MELTNLDDLMILFLVKLLVNVTIAFPTQTTKQSSAVTFTEMGFVPLVLSAHMHMETMNYGASMILFFLLSIATHQSRLICFFLTTARKYLLYQLCQTYQYKLKITNSNNNYSF